MLRLFCFANSLFTFEYMKIVSLFFFLLYFTADVSAQQLTTANRRSLEKKEDSLKAGALKIITGINAIDKFEADSLFTRGLVKALKTPYSFDYPFDSLINISKVYPEDSSFRIFTWQMVINENMIRQHGAIQMRTADGSLRLFPLIDKSDVTQNMADTVGNNLGWIGAVYYRAVQKSWQNKTYYTLLGFDENNIRSDKKIMEVLTFENGSPVFGNRNFVFQNGNVYTKNIARYIMEFKKETSPRLTYDKDLDMIIMEHLVSESNEPNKKWTLIPDGDYEGFKWINGRWAYVSKVFNEVTPEGKAPTPQTIRDDKGNIEYEKLKNGEKPTPPKPF